MNDKLECLAATVDVLMGCLEVVGERLSEIERHVLALEKERDDMAQFWKTICEVEAEGKNEER